MIFNTWIYGVFLAAFFILYWTVVPAKYRPVALLAAGLVFYTYYYPVHTLLIAGFILVTYGCGTVIYNNKFHPPYFVLGGRPATGAVFVLSVTVCLGLLAYYKYFKLFAAIFNDLTGLLRRGTSLQVPDLVIPLGLSFFVFEFIHYLSDTYRGTAPRASLTEYAAFGLFFPTLVAGPIKRFQPFMEQLRNPAAFRLEFLGDGLYRILTGIGKKVIVADSMVYFTDPLADPLNAAPGDLWVAVYAYAVKIYFDFAGYSDIAIGSARLLGFTVPENFNRPYLRQNIAAFWNNWHISLSSWIRDYIYYPLGGSRGTLLFTIRNLVIALALSGLWHGAAWNFLVWGLYHGAGLSLYRVYRKKGGWFIKYVERLPVPLVKAGSVLLTFHFVCVGWVFFATDLRDSFRVLAVIFEPVRLIF